MTEDVFISTWKIQMLSSQPVYEYSKAAFVRKDINKFKSCY